MNQTNISVAKTPHSDRQAGIAYTTWHTDRHLNLPRWSKPLLGNYKYNDRHAIRRHAELLRDAGVDFILNDWSNNTNYIPPTSADTHFKQLEEGTDILFEEWSKIEGAPKICFLMGPGHSGIESVKSGNHDRKIAQIYRDYVEKYPDLYYKYTGKPLVVCYGATPTQYGANPSEIWDDERFTVRWLTGYVGQQKELFDRVTRISPAYLSWEERGEQTYTVADGRAEFMTVSAATRAQLENREEGREYIPAAERRGGETFRKQFKRAMDIGAGVVLLTTWNEWVTSEQPSLEGSRDLEPSEAHGTLYYDLMCELIREYKGKA